MNREIKFRGKRIDNGEWVYGYIVKSVNDRCYIIGYATEDAVNTRNEIDFMYNEVDHKTVGQCTGYKDKNRKEIYEGDIIKFDTNYIRAILFNDGCFRLKDTPYQNNYNSGIIIGNIYETELIKGD